MPRRLLLTKEVIIYQGSFTYQGGFYLPRKFLHAKEDFTYKEVFTCQRGYNLQRRFLLTKAMRYTAHIVTVAPLVFADSQLTIIFQ